MGLALGTNGIDFRSKMNLRAEWVRKRVQAKIVAYSTTLHQQLVQNTPILTGQARANWQAAMGAPNAAPIGPGGPGSALAHGPPASVPYQAYVGQQEALIATWQPGQTLYIFSNLPYIEALNSGSSRQAPAGFVEAAILTAKATYRTA